MLFFFPGLVNNNTVTATNTDIGSHLQIVLIQTIRWMERGRRFEPATDRRALLEGRSIAGNF